MGADYPDWGGQYNDTAFYPLFDLGELAVRLGAPITHDRRGNVVWFTTFEYGLVGITTGVSGTGSSVDLEASIAESFPFSAKLTAGTTNPSYAQIAKFTPRPQSKNIGFSAMVQPASGLDSFLITLVHVNETRDFSITLTVNMAAQTVTVSDGPGNSFTLATGIDVSVLNLFFSHLKVVMDTENAKGVRAIFNGTEYDLSGLALQTQAGGLTSRINVTVKVNETGGVAKVCYCDNMIITASEPDNS